MKRIILMISLFSALTNISSAKVSDSSTTDTPFNNLLKSEKRTINIYHNIVPSVVNVSNIRVADSFFYGKVEVPQGAGTGFVWDKEGHIVTNFHVVQGGDSFVITFHNSKKQYKAKVVGVAPSKDIAV